MPVRVHFLWRIFFGMSVHCDININLLQLSQMVKNSGKIHSCPHTMYFSFLADVILSHREYLCSLFFECLPPDNQYGPHRRAWWIALDTQYASFSSTLQTNSSVCINLPGVSKWRSSSGASLCSHHIYISSARTLWWVSRGCNLVNCSMHWAHSSFPLQSIVNLWPTNTESSVDVTGS